MPADPLRRRRPDRRLRPGAARALPRDRGLRGGARRLRRHRAARSRRAERLANPPDGRSICDALLAPTPGELTFEINRRVLAGGLAVADEDVLRAMGFAFRDLKLVVEPGGAVALAALLAGRFDARGRTVAVVLSGGNVDPALFARRCAIGRRLRLAARREPACRAPTPPRGRAICWSGISCSAARIGVHPHEQQRAPADPPEPRPGRGRGGQPPRGPRRGGRLRGADRAGPPAGREPPRQAGRDPGRAGRRPLPRGPRVRSARVRVEKLDAIPDAAAVGVEIERIRPRDGPGEMDFRRDRATLSAHQRLRSRLAEGVRWSLDKAGARA